MKYRTWHQGPELTLRQSHLRFALSACLLASACGRATGDSDPRVSGSTNWLECVEVDDCVGVSHASCEDGYCLDANGRHVTVGSVANDGGTHAQTRADSGGAQSAPSSNSNDAAPLPTLTDIPPSASLTPDAGDAAGGGMAPAGECTLSFDANALPEFLALPENNATLETHLDVQMQTVRSDTNLTFDWSTLTQDFVGASVDPETDAKLLVLTMRALTPAGLIDELDAQTPSEAETLLYLDFHPEAGETSVTLAEAQVSGTSVDLPSLLPFFDADPSTGYDPENYTFSLMLQSADAPGSEVRTLSFFKLDSEATAETVNLTDSSAQLEYSVDLAGKPPLMLPTGNVTRGLTFDWSQLGSNATRVFIDHYDAPLDELDAQFLTQPDLPRQRWEAAVTGKQSIKLYELIDGFGDSFSGIDASGTWVLGLEDEYRVIGLPTYLTVLSVCE